jgi:hypothetical protein
MFVDMLFTDVDIDHDMRPLRTLCAHTQRGSSQQQQRQQLGTLLLLMERL